MMYIRLHINWPLLLSDFTDGFKALCLDWFAKNFVMLIWNIMKICSAGAELLHAEEQAHKQAEEWTEGRTWQG